MRCPLSDVTRFEAYQGRKSLTRQVMGIGFVLGAMTGFAVAHRSDCGDLDRAICIVGGVTLGGGAVLLIGAAAGAVIRTDRWEAVSLDRLRVSVLPHRDGFGIGARIAF
jgi:hypothetical protein